MAWRGHHDRVISQHITRNLCNSPGVQNCTEVQYVVYKAEMIDPEMSGYPWKYTYIHKQGYPEREGLCLWGQCVVQWANRQRLRFGLASPQKALGKQWFDPSLRCLKWSYCQMQDDHLERECLTGKRANYKFRLLPWCFADPSTCNTETPRKARNRMKGRWGEIKPAWARHPSHCLHWNADKKGPAKEPGKECHFQHVLGC